MTKRIQYNFTSGELVTIPSDLGYYGPSSKSRDTYEFVEYRDENSRCILKNLETGKTGMWSIGWVKPLKKRNKK